MTLDDLIAGTEHHICQQPIIGEGCYYCKLTKTLKKIKELTVKLPHGLEADWDKTNHYELTTPNATDDYWWLCVDDAVGHSETEAGQRLGTLLDIAAELSKLKENL